MAKKNPDSSPAVESGRGITGTADTKITFFLEMSILYKELEKTFSSSRMSPYLRRCSGCEERAAVLYQHNISLSRSLYPILNYVEVAIRNTISECLKAL